MNEEPEQAIPEELVAKFARCAKYPTEKQGIVFLAQGLVKASQATGISIDEIVDACLPIARYCPTDAEFLNIARNLREDRQRQAESKRSQEAEWRKQYGQSAPFDWKAEAAKIMPEAKLYWAKDAARRKLMKATCLKQGIKLKNLGYADRFRMQIWAQEQVGLPVTPEQQKELSRLG